MIGSSARGAGLAPGFSMGAVQKIKFEAPTAPRGVLKQNRNGAGRVQAQEQFDSIMTSRAESKKQPSVKI
jgi:hypothetical protein